MPGPTYTRRLIYEVHSSENARWSRKDGIGGSPQTHAGPKQALVRIAASGVNFIDVYFARASIKADIPITLGSEGAGTVEPLARMWVKSPPATRSLRHGRAAPTPEYALVRRRCWSKSRWYRLSKPPLPPCSRA